MSSITDAGLRWDHFSQSSFLLPVRSQGSHGLLGEEKAPSVSGSAFRKHLRERSNMSWMPFLAQKSNNTIGTASSCRWMTHAIHGTMATPYQWRFKQSLTFRMVWTLTKQPSDKLKKVHTQNYISCVILNTPWHQHQTPKELFVTDPITADVIKERRTDKWTSSLESYTRADTTR